MTAYLADRELAKIASIQRRKDAWKAMRPFWENVLPSLIDDQMCRAYETQRRAGAATIRYELSQLSVALRWAAAKDYIGQAPEIYRPEAPERSEKHLTKAEFARFLRSCKAPHIRLYAILGITTAARPSAIMELTWDRVDFESGMINLNPVGRIQTAKRRPRIAMNDVAREALEEAYRARQSAYVVERGGERVHSVKKGFLAASERCGLKVTPYTLRHTAAVWMAEDRVPMAEIAQFLGHDDDRTTQRHYARFSPDFLRGAANALRW